MKKLPSAAISVLAVSTCAVLGSLNGPQSPLRALWYWALRKPRYTPPGLAVGPTWLVLEILLAYAGFRLLRAPRSSRQRVSLWGWSGTLLGLAGFPAVFFKRRQSGESFAAAAAMTASAAGTVIAARKIDAAAAAAMIPVVAWLAFATLLTHALVDKNRGSHFG